jgi:hypothetical protein
MLGLTTSHILPCPKSKYDMHAYMAKLFEGEAWDLV